MSVVLDVPRGGKTLSVSVAAQSYKKTKENDPIGANRIIGVDTESLTVSGILQTVLVPYSTAFGDYCQSEPINNDIDPITIMLDFTMQHFGEEIDRPSRATYRLKKGTRESITPVLWVFYNLEYDLQRLFNADSGFFRVLRQGRDDMLFNVNKYTVQIVACNPTGSAPSFQMIVSDHAAKRVCRIYGMDMWGYWKTGLGKTAASMNVGEKLSADVPTEWFDIPLDDWTDDMWATFVRYASTDGSLTRGVYIATAELLGSFSKAVFNRVGMLPPSAPAAAARMAFSYASEEEWDRPDKPYEQLALDAYHGGYVGMTRRGYVTGLTVADLHSAYPSAMLLLPDPCRVKFATVAGGMWKEIPPGYRKLGCLGFVRATFTISPALFPSISKTDKRFTLHQPGTYKRFAISLPELSALFDLGQIDQADIHGGYLLIGDSKTSFLRQFVEYFYDIKSKEEERAEKEGTDKNTPLYLAAKLLMNALYGKLIEVRKPSLPALEHEPDLYENIILPPGFEKRSDNFKMIAQLYVDGGTQALFAYSRRNTALHMEQAHITGEPINSVNDLPCMMVHQILQREQATAGAYFMPIYASLITAMTRAKLAIMLNCFDAIGGDTDSVFSRLRYKIDGIKSITWIAAEAKANDMAVRAGVGPVEDQPGLLGYGVEMENASGYVAGIKQYTLTADGYKPKLAHHAITDPPDTGWQQQPGKSEAEKKKNARTAFCSNAVKQLALGHAVTYVTRKKPRRLRESLLRNDGLYGVFVTRERTVTPKEDERLIPVGRDEHQAIVYEWTPLEQML